jgi:hypothetical protein
VGNNVGKVEKRVVEISSGAAENPNLHVVVHAFAKKTQKTPQRALEIARARAKEVV